MRLLFVDVYESGDLTREIVSEPSAESATAQANRLESVEGVPEIVKCFFDSSRSSMSSRHGDEPSYLTEGEVGVPFRWDSEFALVLLGTSDGPFILLSSRSRSKELNRLGGGVVAEISALWVSKYLPIRTLACMAPLALIIVFL